MIRPSGLFSGDRHPAGCDDDARSPPGRRDRAWPWSSGCCRSSSSAFRDYQMAEVAVYVVAIAGLTVLIGLSGQISIGNGAFMAIGALRHRAAAARTWAGRWWLVFAGQRGGRGRVVGAVVGVAAARLRGPYLAGATLMLAVALPSLANQFPGVFGGDQGLTVTVTAPGFLGATFPPTRWLAWVTCAAALIALVLLANLARSRVGRSWRAVRDDEVAAALAGLNVARLRVLAFVVSAACAGLGRGHAGRRHRAWSRPARSR